MSAATTTRRRRSDIPGTPRVISPSPTPSERLEVPEYSGPMTRSARKRLSTPQPVEEEVEEGEDEDEDEDEQEADDTEEKAARKKSAGSKARGNGKAAARGDRGKGKNKTSSYVSDSSEENGQTGMRRARTRSRSPIAALRMTTGAGGGDGKAARQKKTTASTTATETETTASATARALAMDEAASSTSSSRAKKAKPGLAPVQTNGHLQPPGATWSWRDFSRSPSPLGLIPIHRHWRSFVHKHEVPRKLLHVSIGFLVVWLYASGTQTRAVCPYLMGALLPIATVDLLRHRWPALNRLYVRLLGALMRESEFDGYNGVIFYLLGAWTVLYFFPKDVATVSVMLLSWCDTAASTFGRLYGRYTPRIRRGKSVAGTAAAFLVGVATAASFWGWLATYVGPMPGDAEGFQFHGTLGLPPSLASLSTTRISGALALGVVSVWSGLVAAVSEVVDLFGWDDNLTIPVLSGAGIWAFLRVFG